MKRLLLALCLLLVLAGVGVRLYERWLDERQDRALAIMVDWSEMRDATAREAQSSDVLLRQLKEAGADTILVGASTVRDFAAGDFSFDERDTASLILKHLVDRGVAGIRIEKTPVQWKITRLGQKWDPLSDLEVGFDPRLLEAIKRAGLHLVLRVNSDPWLNKATLFDDLRAIGINQAERSYLLNTDDIPGGPEALRSWQDLIKEQNAEVLVFEFHPSKSTLKLAMQVPAYTYRAHTIAPNELKDLTDTQQSARWYRAVQERSCRFLLIHIAPSQSVPDFLNHVRSLRDDFQNHGWIEAFPKPRLQWDRQPFMNQRLGSVLALAIAILVPMAALKVGRQQNEWSSFITVTFLTLVGACLMAAVADHPLTRVQVVPFRGIKLAFVSAWLGSFLSLYSWSEIRDQLYRPIRRVDVVAGVVAAALVAYILIRMGNAGAGWKAGWEQGVRDRLEDWLVARPRFKEFALGYPLLILGFHDQARSKVKSFWTDGRFLITLGMIGPISMVNTFCHIHSPLYLAFLRSVNGIVLGALLGGVLLVGRKKMMTRFEK